MKKYFIVLLVFVIFFISCEKKDTQETKSVNSICYVDGTYKATSSIKDEWGGSAEVEIVVKDGKIISCTFNSYDEKGILKDAEYGKIDGAIKNIGLYKIAQNALIQSNKYGDMLVKNQDIEKLDAISGATVSFGLFKNAVIQIIEKAKIPTDDCNDKEDNCNKRRG